MNSPFGFIILLGITALITFSAAMAHRGHATKGTWTLLVSASIQLVLILILGGRYTLGFSHMVFEGSSTNFDSSEILWKALLAFYLLSFIGMAVGAFLMTSHWKKLSEETEELEQLAHQLASEREA